MLNLLFVLLNHERHFYDTVQYIAFLEVPFSNFLATVNMNVFFHVFMFLTREQET